MTEYNESIGLPGIDTDFERDKLDYRPNITWERPTLQSEWGNEISEAEMRTDELTRPAMAELWDNFTQVVTKINELEETLSDQLRDSYVLVPSQGFASDLRMAATRYDFSLQDRIPFALYKTALRDRDCLERQIILDTWENYHSDVTGDLKAELYLDVAEMQMDWEDMFQFLNKGVFSQLVQKEDLPKEASKNESIEKILKQEETMNNAYKSSVSETKNTENSLRAAYLNSMPTEEIVLVERDLERLRNVMSDIERRVHTKKEAIDLSNSKARRAMTNIGVLEYGVKTDPYKDERKSILISLLKPYLTGQATEKGLRKIQALLKLSVDGKNSSISEMKANLRSMSGRENRKRVNGALVNGIHLRNEVVGEVFDSIHNLEDDKELVGFGKAVSHIIDSLLVGRRLFKDNASDFYKMHTLESEVRLEKVGGVIEKDSAREIYKLLDALIAYGKERNSWPNEGNLVTWVDNFLASQKLS